MDENQNMNNGQQTYGDQQYNNGQQTYGNQQYNNGIFAHTLYGSFTDILYFKKSISII